jgi:hypothetical protein
MPHVSIAGDGIDKPEENKVNSDSIKLCPCGQNDKIVTDKSRATILDNF